ncbi:MAG: hypothetical protein L6U16_11470 [Porphyromonadaceae bacterium]|nr:MAG: hypothetical protein L6U16_11470 [Porphyromonadaceae bacterium]
MTKRTYIIIIALLVALDIATGFWYIVNHINTDGKSDLFDRRSELIATADTIADTFVPDKFEVSENNAYFVSKAPAIDDDAQTYYASIKRIKSKLPTEINGNKNIDAIFAAIADKAFPKSHSNYQGGIHAFLKTPVFNASGVDYKPLDAEPTITQKYGNVQGVKIYPTFSSRGYLVMAISLTSYDSGKKREKIYYVNYNRRGQSVLSFNSIFASNSEDALLTLVNNKIESLADDEAYAPSQGHTPFCQRVCTQTRHLLRVSGW